MTRVALWRVGGEVGVVRGRCGVRGGAGVCGGGVIGRSCLGSRRFFTSSSLLSDSAGEGARIGGNAGG